MNNKKKLSLLFIFAALATFFIVTTLAGNTAIVVEPEKSNAFEGNIIASSPDTRKFLHRG